MNKEPNISEKVTVDALLEELVPKNEKLEELLQVITTRDIPAFADYVAMSMAQRLRNEKISQFPVQNIYGLISLCEAPVAMTTLADTLYAAWRQNPIESFFDELNPALMLNILILAEKKDEVYELGSFYLDATEMPYRLRQTWKELAGVALSYSDRPLQKEQIGKLKTFYQDYLLHQDTSSPHFEDALRRIVDLQKHHPEINFLQDILTQELKSLEQIPEAHFHLNRAMWTAYILDDTEQMHNIHKMIQATGEDVWVPEMMKKLGTIDQHKLTNMLLKRCQRACDQGGVIRNLVQSLKDPTLAQEVCINTLNQARRTPDLIHEAMLLAASIPDKTFLQPYAYMIQQEYIADCIDPEVYDLDYARGVYGLTRTTRKVLEEAGMSTAFIDETLTDLLIDNKDKKRFVAFPYDIGLLGMIDTPEATKLAQQKLLSILLAEGDCTPAEKLRIFLLLKEGADYTSTKTELITDTDGKTAAVTKIEIGCTGVENHKYVLKIEPTVNPTQHLREIRLYDELKALSVESKIVIPQIICGDTINDWQVAIYEHIPGLTLNDHLQRYPKESEEILEKTIDAIEYFQEFLKRTLTGEYIQDIDTTSWKTPGFYADRIQSRLHKAFGVTLDEQLVNKLDTHLHEAQQNRDPAWVSDRNPTNMIYVPEIKKISMIDFNAMYQGFKEEDWIAFAFDPRLWIRKMHVGGILHNFLDRDRIGVVHAEYPEDMKFVHALGAYRSMLHMATHWMRTPDKSISFQAYDNAIYAARVAEMADLADEIGQKLAPIYATQKN